MSDEAVGSKSMYQSLEYQEKKQQLQEEKEKTEQAMAEIAAKRVERERKTRTITPRPGDLKRDSRFKIPKSEE